MISSLTVPIIVIHCLVNCVFGQTVKCNVEDPTHLNCKNITLDELSTICSPVIYKELYIETPNIMKINAHAFDFPELQNLEINGYNLEEIDNNAFANLTKLQRLTIRYTDLRVVKRRVFSNITKLKKLQVTNNRNLDNIESGAFDSLVDLIELDLKYNKLKDLPSGLIDSLGRLNIFHVGHNQLVSLPNGFFLNAYSLRTLDLRSNKINVISNGIFRSEALLGSSTVSNLVKINFDDNIIPHLNRSALAHLDRVETISFKQCHLEDITTDAFAHMRNLKELDLNTNKLGDRGLAKIDFSNLRQLTTLKLALNKLKNFTSRFLANTSLQSLDLSFNEFTELTSESFAYILELRTLDLGYNKIAKLQLNTFQNLSALIDLDLQFNSIESIHPGTFAMTTNLVTLNLVRNNITELLPGTFDVYDPYENDTTSRLKTLLLSYNQLSNLTKDAFEPLRNLIALDLSLNRIESLPHDIFTSMTALKSLTLNDNRIQTLPPRLFEPVGQTLLKLDLSYNPQIVEINSELFKPLVRLNSLELKSLGIESFDEEIFNLSSLKSLNLNHNAIRYLSKDALHGDDCVLETLSVFNNRFTFIDPEFFDNTNLNVFRYENNPWLCVCLDQMLAKLKQNGINAKESHYSIGQKPSCVIGPNRTACIQDVALNDEIYKEYLTKFAEYVKGCPFPSYC